MNSPNLLTALLSGVLAALFTQGLAWLREWLGENKQAKFAALYVAIALESYARACATMIGESETYDASDGAAGSAHINLPELPEYPEVDWKAFGIRNAEKAMAFRTKIDADRATFREMWEHLDPEDVVPDVRERTARHGMTALSMAATFRAAYGLNPLDDFGEFTTEGFLKRKHDEHVERRVRYEAQLEKSRREAGNLPI